jgi:hypothetical protein
MLTTQILFRVDEDLLNRIEDWRRQRRPTIPARAEALRELVQRALDSDKPA